MPARDISCSGCGRAVLYGLVANPVHDPRVVDRASRILSAAPGGPSLGEATRRIYEGLPLIVGLSREDTEKVQERLVNLGLLPRIGPAPQGTRPLGSAPAPAPSPRRWAVGMAVVAALGGSLWLALGGGTSTPRAVVSPASAATPRGVPSPPPPTPTAIPPEDRVLLRVSVMPEEDGSLTLAGVAEVRTLEDPPNDPLLLTARAEGGEVVNASVPDSSARLYPTAIGGAKGVAKMLPFRVPIESARLAGSREMVLEAGWGRWRSGPTRVRLLGE